MPSMFVHLCGHPEGWTLGLTESGQSYILMGITVTNQSYLLLRSIYNSSMHTAQFISHMVHMLYYIRNIYSPILK